MKITKLNAADHPQINQSGVGHAEGAGGKAVEFSKALHTQSREQYEQMLSKLVARIDEQGKKLMKRADVGEFERYRSMIRDFMQEIVSNGYEFSRDSSFIGRGRHRMFATVRTIDEKLDALGKEVLSGQAEQLSIVHKIDDIRGLLLDLLL